MKFLGAGLIAGITAERAFAELWRTNWGEIDHPAIIVAYMAEWGLGSLRWLSGEDPRDGFEIEDLGRHSFILEEV